MQELSVGRPPNLRRKHREAYASTREPPARGRPAADGRGYAASCRKAPSSSHRTLAADGRPNPSRRPRSVAIERQRDVDVRPQRPRNRLTGFPAANSVFHEWRCFGLWKSLFATYG